MHPRRDKQARVRVPQAVDADRRQSGKGGVPGEDPVHVVGVERTNLLLSSGAYKQAATMAHPIYDIVGDEAPGFFESLALMWHRKHQATQVGH